MVKAGINALEALHNEICRELTERIKSGEATAGDIANAIRYLKDNGIEADMVHNKGIKDLMESIEEAVVPFPKRV